MTVENVIALIDTIRPNTVSYDEKVLWVNNLEKQIADHMTRYGESDVSFSPLTQNSMTLLNSEHIYMYAYYGVSMIDLANQDIAMYNNSCTFFNNAFESWQKKWRRENLPKCSKGGDKLCSL